MGGRHIGKDVVLTFYLRLVESRKFKITRTIKQWLDVHGVCIILEYRLILIGIYILRGLRHCLFSGDRQCESLTSGIGKVQIPALFLLCFKVLFV